MDDLQPTNEQFITKAEFDDFKNRVFANHAHRGGHDDGLKIDTGEDMDINEPKDLSNVFMAGHGDDYSSAMVVFTLKNATANQKNLYVHGIWVSEDYEGNEDTVQLQTAADTAIASDTGLTEVNLRLGDATAAVGAASYGGTLTSPTLITDIFHPARITGGANKGAAWIPFYSDLTIPPGRLISITTPTGGGIAAFVVWREL